MGQRAVFMHTTQRTMVSELQPSDGEPFQLIFFGGLLVLRQLAKLNFTPLAKNPAFWLACVCWILSFKARRFAEDWGWPALMVLAAGDLQLLLQSRFAAGSFKRLALAAGIAGIFFLVFTSDIGGRWTQSSTWQFLSTEEHPELAGWMPEKGGILYSADMSIFYQTFYKNPDADWRYVLGYESGLMSDEDFKVYQSVLWNFGDSKAYGPWVKKMTPADRLVIRGDRSSPPGLPQLEWDYGVSGIWIGRLSRPAENGTAPPTIPATAPLDSLTNSVPKMNSAK
jgi:hypothetical protein